MTGTVRVLLCALMILVPTARGAEPAPLEGSWRGKIEGDVLTLNLEVDWRGTTERVQVHVPLVQLEGADPEKLSRWGATSTFTWVREPGVLRFEGRGGWLWRPSGSLSYQPDPAFAEALAEMELGSPDPLQSFALAAYGVGIDQVRAWEQLGHRASTVRDLVRLAVYRIDLDYLKSAARLTPTPTVDELFRLYHQGVPGSTFEQLADLNLASVPVDDLLRFHLHGVAPTYLRALEDAGVPAAASDDVVRLYVRGIGAAFVAGVRAAGLSDYDLDQVIRLYSHGVDAEQAREFAALGYDRTDAVVELWVRGIRPRQVREFHDQGYERLQVDEVIRLYTHGVGADFLRELAEAGHVDLTVDEILRYRTQGYPDRRS